MPKKLPTLNLPPAGDLFTTQAERDDAQRERVVDLPLNEISDFPNHPFKVRVDTEMQEMAESVKQYGVAVKMRKLSDGVQLTNDIIASIMQEIKPAQAEHFRLPREKIQQFFSLDTPAQTIEETIIKALELWYSKQKR